MHEPICTSAWAFPGIAIVSAYNRAGCKKNSSIRLNSLPESATDSIRIYYVIEGKFEWHIHQQQHMLYPGDVALILPGQKFGSEKGFLEIGSLSWIHINIHKLESGEMIPGRWSSLSESESLTIGKILFLNNSLVLSKLNEAGRILQYVQSELFNQEIGYATRVNNLIDELFITITRQLTRQSNPAGIFPKHLCNWNKHCGRTCRTNGQWKKWPL